MNAGTQFTLPPSPDELAEAREHELETDTQGRRRSERIGECKRKASEAWKRVPTGFGYPLAELLERCKLPLRKVAQVDTVAALLVGPTGSGKTTGAAVLVRRALNDFVHSEGERFACATDLVWTSSIDIALAERRNPLGAEPELLRRARTCGLLVLDDLGIEPDGIEVFHTLSHRYHAEQPFITTSGLTLAGLSKHMGAAGVRRLHEQHVAGMGVLLVDAHPKTAPVKPPRTPGR